MKNSQLVFYLVNNMILLVFRESLLELYYIMKHSGLCCYRNLYHLEVDSFPVTACPNVFQSSYTTVICQQLQVFMLLYVFIFMFNAVERPRDRLVPVVTYVLGGINSLPCYVRSPLS